MPRRPSVRYFPSRGGYYCQIKGVQHKLATGPDDALHGPTYLEALRQFHHLMQMGDVEVAGGTNTVRVVLESYMQHTSGRLDPETV
jgi:hypothetical protein